MNNFNKLRPATVVYKEVIKDWVISNIETLDVGLVVDNSSYSIDRQVSVLPLCIQEDLDGVSPSKPRIDKCVVILQGNRNGFINFPMEVGTKVLIGYPKDSIEEFLFSTEASQYYQVDSMKFQGSQAVVLGYAAQAAGVDKPVSISDFEINYFDSLLSITPSNKITLKNPNASITEEPDGTIVVTNGAITWTLTPSGEGSLVNSSGNVTLLSSGSVDANGCITTTGGNVITAAGTDVDQLRADLDAFKVAYEAHGSGSSNHPPPPPF